MTRRALQWHMRALQEELHTLEQRVSHCAISPPGMRRRMLMLAVGFVLGYFSVARDRTRSGIH